MGLYRRGKTYWITMRADGRRIQMSTGTDNRKLAEKIFSKTLLEQSERKHFPVKRALTMQEVFRKYMEEVSPFLSPSTHQRNIQIVTKFSEVMGHEKIEDITPAAISAYKASRLQQVSPSTVRRELSLLRRIFNLSVNEWELCDANPVNKVMKSIRVDDSRVREIDPEEALKLKFTLPLWLKRIVVVASQTGLRRSNLLALTVGQVDFNGGFITIPRTKNGMPLTIPMAHAVSGTIREAILDRKVHSQYVFCDKDGKQYNGHAVSMAFKRACEKAGIKNLRFHDLRHDFATQLVRQGVDIYRIQKLCGHKDQRMTQRYAHLRPEGLKDAVNALNGKGTATILLHRGEQKGATLA